MRLDPKFIDHLSRRLSESLPPGLNTLRKDTEQHMQYLLQSSFAKLNLVTREDFDIQRAVLQRTREKLEKMEQQVRQLEERLKTD